MSPRRPRPVGGSSLDLVLSIPIILKKIMGSIMIRRAPRPPRTHDDVTSNGLTDGRQEERV